MKFKPLADRVLIKAHSAEQTTDSGIIIPEGAQEKPLTGIVIAVGPGKKDVTMTVKKDDEVLYGTMSGNEIEIEGEKYMLMREAAIYGIL